LLHRLGAEHLICLVLVYDRDRLIVIDVRSYHTRRVLYGPQRHNSDIRRSSFQLPAGIANAASPYSGFQWDHL